MLPPLFLLTLALLPFSKTTPYPSPGPCTGTCTGPIHDPSLIRRRTDGLYFRFTTSNRLNTATAPTLSGPWSEPCPALPHCSIINVPGRCDLWAPDVVEVQGLYYLFYAVSAIGSRRSEIGVAVSPDLECGSWRDLGAVGVPKGSWNRIDPNFLLIPAVKGLSGKDEKEEEEPKGYLLWGSFWTDLWQLPMAFPPVKLLDESAEPVHLEFNTTLRPQHRPPGPSEGGFQFRWVVDGTQWFYLFFSSGGCCNRPPHLAPAGEECKIMVCRAARPTGPFVDREGRLCAGGDGGTMVLGSAGEGMFAPGGQGVMWDEGLGGVVVYYHYVDLGVGKEEFRFGWNLLDFGEGWPVVVRWEGEGEQEGERSVTTTTATATTTASKRSGEGEGDVATVTGSSGGGRVRKRPFWR
ncbi:hypothetical protein B0A50_05829 [Salinomyces thailandicus]|uniref:Arabinan endo-1,5-alpha-L-arabinosidase n=1 Tax=Salinomyces thailandicus TaxID=706561 RepID=A0A4U0TTV5_9PEZI|nr:hypothetical protein B0A50_05829 [Salinomyces thailandica]